MTFKVIDSREAFIREINGIVADIQQAEISLKAQQEQAKDGFKRCWKCGMVMCEVDIIYEADRYFQCLTKGCNARREFVE